MAEYPLARPYQEVLEESVPSNRIRTPNFALVLEKLQPWRRSVPDGRQTGGNWSLVGDENAGKSKWLRALELKSAYPDIELLNAAYDRWLKVIHGYGAAGDVLETRSRLVVGFGGKTSLETSIQLQRPHGYPYIPGSALKGLCRLVCLASLTTEFEIAPVPMATALQQMKDDKKLTSPGWHTLAVVLQEQGTLKEQKEAWDKLHSQESGAIRQHWKDFEAFESSVKDEQDSKGASIRRFRSIFGTAGRSGDIIFFDGIPEPTTDQLLEADVLTPHFGSYYTGESSTPPRDDLDPVPTVFLAVPANRRFAFAVGIRRGIAPEADSYAQESLQIAWQWLRFTVCEVGVGAKTNAGYGLFKG